MPPGFRYLLVGIKHSGESSLSPKEPRSSDINISPYISFISTFLISPEINETLSERFSSMIIFLRVTIA